MTKPLRKVVPKIKPDLERAIARRAQAIYQEVASDLPTHGSGHYDAAHDHIADRLSDEFGREAPYGAYLPIAKKALKDYVSDDRKETRAKILKLERKRARSKREADERGPEPYTAWLKRQKPKIKPRRGIGSY